MKRLFACSLLLAGIYGCERLCGDLQPLADTTPMGGAGAGGDGRVTAGEGGAPLLPAVGGAGGVPSEGGGGVGGAAGAAGGVSCLPPPDDAKISDFEPTSSALGEMKSKDGGPAGDFVPGWTSGTAYREVGDLPGEGTFGFTFTFKPCVDTSDYVAITFQAQGKSSAGVTVSIEPAEGAAPGTSHYFQPVMGAEPTDVCVPLELGPKTLQALQFEYEPRGSADANVNLLLDNFAFSLDACPGT